MRQGIAALAYSSPDPGVWLARTASTAIFHMTKGRAIAGGPRNQRQAEMLRMRPRVLGKSAAAAWEEMNSYQALWT